MKALLALVSTLLLATCSQPPGVLEQVLAAGELRVVTRNSPDAYYLGSHGPEGPAYELASRFAEHLGVALRLYTVRTREDAIDEVLAGRAHVAAAGITTGVELPPGAHYGPGYHLVREHLIYRRTGHRPRSISDAGRGQIEVATGSPHQRTLLDLRLQHHPELAWVERAGSETEELLAAVSRGDVQYTLASSTEFALNRVVHPELAIALDLSPERAVSWVVSTAAHDRSLLGRVNAFFAGARAEGVVARLLERYYGNRDRFDYLFSRNFLQHVDTRLPRYLEWFQEAAAKYQLDWRLLAAMGYQESKWDPGAVSFTGVRGLMQLTEDTAARVRADRLDPRASIFGGARYLASLIETVPERIPEPDRTWFAVAAYNVGYGHVEDARILTQQHGRNPDRWEDVREFLPLLSQERWYTRTKRGYARGWEPVRYVANVQAYLNILAVAGIGTPPADEQATAEITQPAPPRATRAATRR